MQRPGRDDHEVALLALAGATLTPRARFQPSSAWPGEPNDVHEGGPNNRRPSLARSWCAVDRSNTSRFVVCARVQSMRRDVTVWDRARAEPACVAASRNGEGRTMVGQIAAAFAPNDARFVAAVAPGVRVWDWSPATSRFEQLALQPPALFPVSAVAICASGRKLVVAGGRDFAFQLNTFDLAEFEQQPTAWALLSRREVQVPCADLHLRYVRSASAFVAHFHEAYDRTDHLATFASGSGAEAETGAGLGWDWDWEQPPPVRADHRGLVVLEESGARVLDGRMRHSDLRARGLRVRGGGRAVRGVSAWGDASGVVRVAVWE